MKKLMLGLCAVVALAPAAFAGTEIYSSKETRQVTPECPQWYADNELNLSLSGVYAMTGNSWRDDLYLGVDHAWGGSIDLKFFTHRYFGFGIQGTLLSVQDNERFNNGFAQFRTGDDSRHLV